MQTGERIFSTLRSSAFWAIDPDRFDLDGSPVMEDNSFSVSHFVYRYVIGPSKKLADVTAENVLNRFKEKSFAKGANREIIARCEELSLSLEEFCKIGLEAMQGISGDLGL